MSRAMRALAGVLLAAAATLAVAALSRVPYESPGGRQALVRLSWRALGERVEECRPLSAAEREALPVHMRRSEVCEGRVLPYALEVELDGRRVLADTVRAAGAREDRPLYVFVELPVEPGTHRLGVRFVREGRGGDHEEEPGKRTGATPARLELSRTLRLRAGEVALVTYDPERQALVTRTPTP